MFGRELQTNQSSLHRILWISFLMVGLAIAGVNLYALNKGFSILDEGYYLQSYRMATDGFYLHFQNTPFLVNRLFPSSVFNLIGYRVIHMVLLLVGSGFLLVAIEQYLKSRMSILLNSSDRLLLWSVMLFAAMSTYWIILPTLSYNHLIEWLIVTSEAFLILGFSGSEKLSGTQKALLIALAGFVSVFAIYVKPTTAVLLQGVNISALLLMSRLHQQLWLRNMGCYLLGAGLGFVTGCLSVVSLSELIDYTNFMIHQQKSHNAGYVLGAYFSSAKDMLLRGKGIILSGFLLLGSLMIKPWSTARFGRVGRIGCSAIAVLAGGLNLWALYVFLLPQDVIWKSFTPEVHWFFWWVQLSTFFIIWMVIISLSTSLYVSVTQPAHRLTFLPIALMLLLNPVIGSIGTLNGFGQVMAHLPSWLLLLSLVFLFLKRHTASIVTSVFCVYAILFITLTSVYFVRHTFFAGNSNGNKGLQSQTRYLDFTPFLKDIQVDSDTYHLLSSIHQLSAAYPNAPMLVLFDIPGIQYAMGRSMITRDPWLTNYDMPKTRDDVYNCRVIQEGHNSHPVPTLYVVANYVDFSPKMRDCLSKIGLPNHLKKLGEVHSSIGGFKEPVQVYYGFYQEK